jgi:hypothetical protein
MKSTVISARIPDNIGTLLRNKALKERRTPGQLLRIIVEDYFDKPFYRRNDATENAKRKTI